MPPVAASPAHLGRTPQGATVMAESTVLVVDDEPLILEFGLCLTLT